MKKNKRERDEDSVRHGDQYDTQLLWFLMRHMRNRRPQRVRICFALDCIIYSLLSLIMFSNSIQSYNYCAKYFLMYKIIIKLK